MRHAALTLLAAGMAFATALAAEEQPIDDVLVTTSRQALTGAAIAASQGTVDHEELALRPVYRVGQLLESVPGLVATAHSGEGKANQYLLRGENLDHGIDLANFVDDMPVNRPTNAHGQGYSDLNFVIPQLISSIDYTKGPYYAAAGDFAAVGSEHMRLLDDLPAQISVSAGSLADEELFAGGTAHFDEGGRLLGAVDLGHLDGPFTYPDNFRKIAAAARYSQDNYSLTALYYKGQGRNTTDQPLRAIGEGVIGRYGSLDPSDGNRSERWSLSGHYALAGDGWQFSADSYAIRSTQTLWNNFTHFLDDPVNGDQEQQDETRIAAGGQAALTLGDDTVFGLQERFDSVYIDRRHTRNRVVLPTCNDGNGDYSMGAYVCTADRVTLNDVAPYIQTTTHWLSWLRSVVGAREDYSTARDRGMAGEWLFQPKANLVFGPWQDAEFYIGGGKGFHSDDVRGVLGRVPLQGTQLAIGRAPLMAKSWGEEIGLRAAPIADLQIQLAAFRQDFSSELIYDQDAGQDQATAPSRRQGIEISAEYRPAQWIEISADLAATHARYDKSQAALANDYQILGGTHIANAPGYVGSFGILVDNLGPWFGGVAERILGPYPLTNGPARPSAAGYKETDLDIGYKLSADFSVKLAVFNLLNSKAYAAEYYYATAITARNGIADYQVHPLEPLSVRVTLTAGF